MKTLYIQKSGAENLQLFFDSCYLIQQKLALPVSVLLDSEGRVLSIQIGKSSLPQILKTAGLDKANPSQKYYSSLLGLGEFYNNKLSPNHHNLAKRFHRLEQMEYALQIFQLGYTYQKDNTEYLVDYATCKLKLGNALGALVLLKKAREMKPTEQVNYVLLKGLGTLYALENNKIMVLESFKQALLISPDAEICYNMGILLAQTGNLAKAEPQLKESIRLSRSKNQIDHKARKALYQVFRVMKNESEMKKLHQQGSQIGVQW